MWGYCKTSKGKQQPFLYFIVSLKETSCEKGAVAKPNKASNSPFFVLCSHLKDDSRLKDDI